MAKLHQGTISRLEAWSLKIKPLPSRAFLEAGCTRPEAMATWQRHPAESEHQSHVRVIWNIGSCPLPLENLRKVTLGREPSSAQRKAERTSPGLGARACELGSVSVSKSLPVFSFIICSLRRADPFRYYNVIKPLYSNISIERE